MSPNQVVAWNLRQARVLRGWTQTEAAEHLEPFLGERWSKATYSAAERSVDSDRVRNFSADDLYAFARGFDLPMTLFLTPPPSLAEVDYRIAIGSGVGVGSEEYPAESVDHPRTAESMGRDEYLDLIFELNEDARKRLLREVVELTAQSTLALRRWSAGFAELVANRERSIDALLGTRETRDKDAD